MLRGLFQEFEQVLGLEFDFPLRIIKKKKKSNDFLEPRPTLGKRERVDFIFLLKIFLSHFIVEENKQTKRYLT